MGTYSSIFIEFKKKKQWHLLEANVPLTFVDHSYSEPSWWSEDEPDVHTRAPRKCSRLVGWS